MVLAPGKKQKKEPSSKRTMRYVRVLFFFLATFLSAKGEKAEVFFLGKREKTSETSGAIWRNDFGAGQEAKKEPSSKRTMTYVRVWLFF